MDPTVNVSPLNDKQKPKPRDPNWRWLRALKPKVKPDKKKYERKKIRRGGAVPQ